LDGDVVGGAFCDWLLVNSNGENRQRKSPLGSLDFLANVGDGFMVKPGRAPRQGRDDGGFEMVRRDFSEIMLNLTPLK
jgi:hypothetical protein